MLVTVLGHIEALGASTIGQSPLATGFLSAVHLLGLTLIGGAVLVSSLRLFGLLLADHPVPDVAHAAARGLGVGLAISVVSGLILLAPRLSGTLRNGIFQVKIVLVVTAAIFHFTVYRRTIRTGARSSVLNRLSAGIALLLWLGVAVAGCALILLE